jgi:hypothetical protein
MLIFFDAKNDLSRPRGIGPVLRFLPVIIHAGTDGPSMAGRLLRRGGRGL